MTRGDWWYYQTNWIGKNIECHVKQWSPTFLAPGTSCVEDNFSTDGGGGRFHDDSSTLHLPSTLFLLLHWLHLRSSDIRSWRLGTPDVKVWTKELQDPQRIYFLPSAKGDRGTPLSPSLREQEGVHNTPTGHLQRLPTSKRNRSRPPPVLRISGVCVWGGGSQQKRSQVTPNLFPLRQATGSASSHHRSQVKQTLKDLLPAPHLTQEETKAWKTERYGQLYLPRCTRWGPRSRRARDQDRARPACIRCFTPRAHRVQPSPPLCWKLTFSNNHEIKTYKMDQETLWSSFI